MSAYVTFFVFFFALSYVGAWMHDPLLISYGLILAYISGHCALLERNRS